MAIFVGSNNNDSKIRDNRVGLANSTSNPSSPDTGDAYYNSTDNKLTVYNGSDWASAGGGGTIEMVASGTLANGQTVIIQSDGTVTGIGSTAISQSVGTAVTFESGNTKMYYQGQNMIYDSSNEKIVIFYEDESNNDYGTAVVGTVDGNSNTITFGTPVVFEDGGATSNIAAAYNSTRNECIIGWFRGSYLYGAVGRVSGNIITFHNERIVNAAANYVSIAYDPVEDAVVYFYQDTANSNRGTARVGKITDDTFNMDGSERQFNSTTSGTKDIQAVYDTASGKIVIIYVDAGNSSKSTAIVGTVDGSGVGDISFGSEVTFSAANETDRKIGIVYDAGAEKVVVFYSPSANSFAAKVGTVSGTSISFGSQVINDGSYESVVGAYNSVTQKIVVAYTGPGNGIDFTEGTVTGTAVTFTVPNQLNSAIAGPKSLVFDSSASKIVIAYENESHASGTDPGEAQVYISEGTNLTSENFIGFSDAAYSNGATANIQIEGSVDDAQSSLTTAKTHYIQNDGSLSTTAGTPSVEAGTAISSTQIIVKG